MLVQYPIFVSNEFENKPLVLQSGKSIINF